MCEKNQNPADINKMGWDINRILAFYYWVMVLVRKIPLCIKKI